MRNEFTYVIHPPLEDDDPALWVAFCAEVPEASGQGPTRDAAIDHLREGIGMILDYRREESLKSLPSDVERGLLNVG